MNIVFQPILRPRIGNYYICRYGFYNATQVCIYVGTTRTGYYKIRKWRANSGRWTNIVSVRKNDLLAVATPEDLRDVGPVYFPVKRTITIWERNRP